MGEYTSLWRGWVPGKGHVEMAPESMPITKDEFITLNFQMDRNNPDLRIVDLVAILKERD